MPVAIGGTGVRFEMCEIASKRRPSARGEPGMEGFTGQWCDVLAASSLGLGLLPWGSRGADLVGGWDGW